MVFKKRQIVVLALILVIVVAGYMQYTYKKSSSASTQKNGEKIGEAVFVDSKNDASLADDDNAAGTGSAVKTDGDFFAGAKLDRETSRSLSMDMLKKITEDSNASEAVKSEAYDKMIRLVDISEKENKIEMLIKEKGFADVVVIFGDNGNMDIVVRAPGLTSAEAAQIADIASRQGNVDIRGIHIRNSV